MKKTISCNKYSPFSDEEFKDLQENSAFKQNELRQSAQPVPRNFFSDKSYSPLEPELGDIENQRLNLCLESLDLSEFKRWLEDYGPSCCAVLSPTNSVLGTGYLIAPDVILTSKHILMPFINAELPLDLVSVCFEDDISTDQVFSVEHAVEDGSMQEQSFDYVLLKLKQPVETRKPIPLLAAQPSGKSFVVHFSKGNPKHVSVGDFSESDYLQLESIYSSLTHHNSSGSPLGAVSLGIIGWHTAYIKDGLRRGELFSSVKDAIPDSLLAKLVDITGNIYGESRPKNTQGIFETLSQAPAVALSSNLLERLEGEILEGPAVDSKSDLNTLFSKQLIENKLYFETPHLCVGKCMNSDQFNIKNTQGLAQNEKTRLVIEVMEFDVEAAKLKINQLKNSEVLNAFDVVVVVGFNEEIKKDSNPENELSDLEIRCKLSDLEISCKEIIKEMNNCSISGSCFPFTWKATEKQTEHKNKGYVFPFLEARSIFSVHPQLDSAYAPDKTIIRTMDADIVNDALFKDLSLKQKQTFRVCLEGLANNEIALLSGGYEWNVDTIKEKFNELIKKKSTINKVDNPKCMIEKLEKIVKELNEKELCLRKKINSELGSKAIYWPEPNLYSSKATRLQGALAAYGFAKSISGKSQQRESTYLVRSVKEEGKFLPVFKTTKPIKNYLDSFLNVLIDVLITNTFTSKEIDKIKGEIKELNQSHFNEERIQSNLNWHGLNPFPSEAIVAIINPILEKLLVEINNILVK